MKKIFVSILFVIATLQVWAYSFSAVAPSGQTLYYNITSAMIPGMPQKVAVTYPGTSSDAPWSGYSTINGNLTIPSTVTYNGTTYTVTEIGDYAFKGCFMSGWNYTLTLPNTLTRIGHYAFNGCVAFGGTLTLPSTITEIGTYSFQNCRFSGVLTLPTSLTEVSNWSFAGCSYVTSIIFPANITRIGNHAFDNCDGLTGALTIPDAVNSIGWRAFYDCDHITSVSTGNGSGTQYIYYGAFCHCGALTSLTIGDKVKRIYDFAFYGCNNLTTVTLGQNLEYLDYSVFEGCTSLAAITMRRSTPPTTTNSSYYYPDPSIVMSIDKGAPESGFSGGTGDCYYHRYNSNSTSFFFICVDRHLFGRTSSTCSEIIYSIVGWNSYDSTSVEAIDQNYYYYNYYYFGALYNTPSGNHPYYSTFNNLNTSAIYLHVPCNAVASYQASPSWSGFNVQGFLTYSLQLQSNADSMGTVALTQWPTCTDPTTMFLATPESGYHFNRWNDSVTDNPRNITLTKDTSFTAIFASDWVDVTTASNNENYGSTSGDGVYAYNTAVTVYANPAVHYHFVSWSDGNTDNPRTLIAEENLTLTAIFALDQHTLIATASNSVQGSVTGSGDYDYGSSTFITAVPETGYYFTHWNDGSTDNPRSVTIMSDTSFTAHFGTYSYTVIVASNDPVKGSVTGGGTYEYGTQIVLTATPNGGYRFVQWGDGSTETPRIVTVTGNVAYTAIFAHTQYSITVLNSTPTMGQVGGGGSYNMGDTVTLTAVPFTGYQFVQWSDGETVNPRQVVVTNDATYIAVFTPNIYTINVNSANSEQGFVSGSGTYSYNTIATLTATANYGYHFVQWSDGNASNPRTINVTSNATYTAQFAPNNYTLTVSSNNAEQGLVSGGGIFTYNTVVPISATAYTGYHFSQWNDGVSDNPRLVTVTGDASYTAIFLLNSYALTVNSSNSEQGSVTGGGTYDYNTSVTLSATANYGYHFVQWTDGEVLNPRTVIVTQDATYTAQFAPNSYTLTVNSLDTSKGTVTGGGSYEYNTSAVLTATANNGYHFTQWNDGNQQSIRIIQVTQDASYQAFFSANTYSVSAVATDTTQGTVTGGGIYEHGSQVILQAIPASHHHFVQWDDGNTSNPRVIIVLQDLSFSALFEPDEQYTLTVVSDNPEHGSVTGGGVFYSGEQTMITANAFEHFIFDHWSDGSSSNPKTVTVIDNITYTAYFVGIQHTVNVFSNDNNLGVVTGGGSYEYGSTATVTATPTAGNHFVRWSNGAEDNPYYFTVYGDVNLIANFAEGVGVSDYLKEDWYLFAQGGYIVLRNIPTDEPIQIYDMVGKLLYSAQSSEEREKKIPVSTAGVYLVRVGEQSLKKIVVTK